MGVASLVLGIISLIIGFVPFCGIIALLPAIIGLILGIIDIVKKTKSGMKKGQSIAGLILSAIAIVVIIFWAIVAFQVEVETNSNFTNEYLENKQAEEQQAEEQKQKEEQERKEEEEKRKQEEEKKKQEDAKKQKTDYKNSCKTYEYKEIARNPEKYKGKQMKFEGEVIQVIEGYFDTVNFRINVTKNEYDFWEDTVYGSYTYSDGESKILEDDIVKIYGECEGTTSYTSIFGQKITIPKINIKYIELVK